MHKGGRQDIAEMLPAGRGGKNPKANNLPAGQFRPQVKGESHL